MADNNRYRDEQWRSSGQQGDHYGQSGRRNDRNEEGNRDDLSSGSEYMGYQGNQSRNIGQWNDQRGSSNRQQQNWNQGQQQQQQQQRVNYVPDHNEGEHYGHGHHGEGGWQREQNDRLNEHAGYTQTQGGAQKGNRSQQRNYDESNSYNQGRDREHSRYEQSNWDPRYRDEHESRREQYGSGNNLYGDRQNSFDRYRNRDRNENEGASWLGDHDGHRTRETGRSDYRHESRSENRGAYAGKGPKNYQRSKERIYEDVCDRLFIDDRLDASEIEVNVDNNEVVLSGTVTSKEAKRRAEDLAESIPGVRNVENRIRVVAPDAGTTETMNTIIRNAGNMPDQHHH